MDFLIGGEAFLAAHKNFRLVGRRNELRKLSSVLMRSKASSVVLVGPGGVGCSALWMGLQASKKDPDVPFDIVSKRLFVLDTDALFSSGEQAQVNSAFQRMLAVLYRTNDSVLIIDDTRDFIDAARNVGSMHFMNALTLAVRNGRTQLIFECRDEDLDMVLKCHSDMRESYTILDIEEPAGETLEKIVTAIGDGLKEHHRISVQPDALLAAIELTTKYRVRDAGLSRAQPERAATLLDRALATYRLDAHGLTDTVAQAEFKRLHDRQKEAEQALVEVEDCIYVARKEEAVKRKGMKGASDSLIEFAQMAGSESEEVIRLLGKQKQIQAEADKHRQEFDELSEKVNSSLTLTRDLVLSEFSRISGISVNKLNENERDKLKRLEAGLKQRIFGQDDAVHRVANAIKVARVGRRNQDGPQASFLFLGPSGVGKTEMAKAVASFLMDDERALSRFDMSEYMEKHAVAKLIGAPPGYEGFEVGGILTNMMRKNPNRILLFDEIEKAHPDVFNVFLQVLDAGRLTDSVGRTCSFSDSVILMTTNIGQSHFLNEDLTPDERRDAVFDELASTYRSEFLNRFAGRQNIVLFNILTLDSIQRIVQREITKLNAAYDGIAILMDETDVFAFCSDHYDPKIGARGLPGYIQANLDPFVANLMLEHENPAGVVDVVYNREKRLLEASFK